LFQFSFWLPDSSDGKRASKNPPPEADGGFQNLVVCLCVQPPTAGRVRVGYLAQPRGAFRHPIHIGDGKLHQFQKRAGTLAEPGSRSTDYLPSVGGLSAHGAVSGHGRIGNNFSNKAFDSIWRLI
jgi:hypothetical protein